MPLAGYILPALPNGDQRWREQQRSVDRPLRNRRERRVRVRVHARARVRARSRGRVRKNLQRSGWALVRVPRRRVHARALARVPRRRVHARARVKELAKARAKAQHAKAVEEVGAPAVRALNPCRVRTVRSSHSPVEVNGPAAERFDTGPIIGRVRRPSHREGRRFLLVFSRTHCLDGASLPGQAARREVAPCQLLRFSGSLHLLPLMPALAHARSRSCGQGGKARFSRRGRCTCMVGRRSGCRRGLVFCR
jgi:hypothetical protein